MKPPIDIIISTYDRPVRAQALVKTLSALLGPADHVYVVWQGDNQPDIADSATVTCIRSSPPNLPKARNRGIFAGHGDICLFLDDDVEIISGDILNLHRKTHAFEDIGGVAGYLDDPVFAKDAEIPSTYDATTGELIQNFSLDKSQFTVSVVGAHMSFKRTALLKVGGFDENFTANALWEEIDLSFRLGKAGWKIYYCAEAKVKHLRERSGGCREQREQSRTYIYHQFANTAYFAARHAKPVHYRPWLRFWKYRLEFLSRKKGIFLKHDPWLIGAGMLGACGGVARYVMKGKSGRLTPVSAGPSTASK